MIGHPFSAKAWDIPGSDLLVEVAVADEFYEAGGKVEIRDERRGSVFVHVSHVPDLIDALLCAKEAVA